MRKVCLMLVVFGGVGLLSGCCGLRFNDVPCYDEAFGKHEKKLEGPRRSPEMNGQPIVTEKL